MKRAIFALLVITIVISACCEFVESAQAKYSGGSGDPNNPYQIGSAADLLALAGATADYNKCFILTADIDMEGQVFTAAIIAADTSSSWNFLGTPFTGVFDGNGHKITHFTINGGSNYYLGLFGYVGSGGQIKNIGVENCAVSGSWYFVGGLVGMNRGTLTSCYATGSVSSSGNGNVGGLVGGNYGNISNCYSTCAVNGSTNSQEVGGLVGGNYYGGTIMACYATGTVSGNEYVGGLCGINTSASLTACYATGAVNGFSGSMYVGGLVGFNDWGGTITDSYATGAISGGSNSQCVGGLAGLNQGTSTITDCRSTGTVSGSHYVGGLVGLNYGTVTACCATGGLSGGSSVGGLVGDNRGTVTACYATSTVVIGSGSSVGGLVGMNSGTVTACYSTGAVTGGDYWSQHFGGLVGSSAGAIYASFWDIETSGRVASGGGKGLTTEQMKTMSIFQNAGWAGRGWVIQDGQNYPRLAWENTGGTPIPFAEPIPLLGAGSETNPYQLWTAEEFAMLSWHASVLDKHIVLMADMNLSGVILYPFGDLGLFTGVFDGNDRVVRSAVINQPGSSFVGLFGSIGSGGQIRNLGVEDVNVTGESTVGGLAGKNSGTITDCCIIGSVSGCGNVGGLVGENSGTLTECYSTGAVSGIGSASSSWFFAGGLVGENDGNISNCYSTGVVSSSGYYIDAGGLAGENSGTITNCYATGAVIASLVGGLIGYNSSTVMDCYATGAVSGDTAGGLVGIGDGGDINNCYSAGTVSGGADSWAGGLVGENTGNISNSYSNSAVSSGTFVGGLVGYSYGFDGHGYISNCYSTGAVSGDSNVGGLVGYNDSEYPGIITACFWDMNTSGQTISASGTGMTTAQMKQQANFAGWDFNNIWRICEGINYPRLLWQIPAADFVCPDGVDFIDYSFFAERWMNTNCAANNNCDGADFDFSGTVDIDDLKIFCNYWLQGL